MELPANILHWLNLFNAYGWFILIFLIELIWPTRKIPFFKKGMISDCIHTFEPYLKAWLIAGSTALLTTHSQDGVLQGALIGQPMWLHFPVLIVLSEVIFYFTHRLMHTNSFLWEFHRVHHSSTTYYSLMTSRFHFMDILFFNVPFILVMSYLGADSNAMFFFATFIAFMDRYGHSNINGPRFTGYFITSPHYHAWHHSSDVKCQNMNFARDFVFMDYLLGTAYYPKDRSPTDFGEPGYSNNFFVQQVQPFIEIIKKLKGKALIPRRSYK